MNTNVKDITIEFVCNNCLRKKIIYLGVSMGIDNLAKHIASKKCLSCGRGGLDVSRTEFFYDSGDQLIGGNK